MREILFLDKDLTLGNFTKEGLYQGVRPFLERQVAQQRELYVTTLADETGRVHLKEIDDLLKDYLGPEKISCESTLWYILPSGTVRKINDDFIYRDTAALGEEFDYWRQFVHRETGEVFDKTTLYITPFGDEGTGFLKDLYLARRQIAPQEYASLRTVMLGDGLDKPTVESDPETPLVIVSKMVREGNWSAPEAAIHFLFSDRKKKPWEVYDVLFARAKGKKIERRISLSGMMFELERGEYGERWIYCP